MEEIADVVWTDRSLLDLRKIVVFNTELHDAVKAIEIASGIV